MASPNERADAGAANAAWPVCCCALPIFDRGVVAEEVVEDREVRLDELEELLGGRPLGTIVGPSALPITGFARVGGRLLLHALLLLLQNRGLDDPLRHVRILKCAC